MSLKMPPGQYYVYPEDDMPESQAQIDLNKYLSAVLEHLYRMQAYFITGNLTILPPGPDYPFEQIVPDIMVIEGVSLNEEERLALKSWDMRQTGRPAPMTVFEISSEKTWRNDLDPKPEHYRQLGVREYFAYDPQRYWPTAVRLRGWRYSNNQIQEIFPMAGQNRLWSETLQSWIEPAGLKLRLTDRTGNLRLTGEEALDLARETEQRAREAAQQARETEQRAREAERKAREAEQQAKEKALQQMAFEQQRAETAERQIEAQQTALQELLEKLRRNNIDPDTL